MNQIIQAGVSITMSSPEMVEFINAHRKEAALAAGAEFPSKGYAKLEHADFCKKVPEVLGRDAGKFSGIYRDSMNRIQDGYHFPKREACLMAMSYSYDLQAKVFDRMTALETAAAPVADPMEVLKDPVSMRTLLLGYSEKLILLEAEKAAMAPKVEAYELIAVSDSDYTITQAAKLLQLVPHNQLFHYLNANQWIYKSNGRGPWLPHVGRIKQGYMVLGGHPVTHSDGRVETEPQSRITAKGLARLATLFAKVPEAA